MSGKWLVSVLGERSAALASTADKKTYVEEAVRRCVGLADLCDDFVRASAKLKP